MARSKMLIKELYEERKEGKFISPPGNTVGLNVFELSPDERQRLNGTVVYHQTKKLDKIMQSGGLRPRADISGENSFAINDMRAGKDWRTPKGIFVSTTTGNWFGDEISFKIEPTDKIYRAYDPTGHLMIANPIPMNRFENADDRQSIKEENLSSETVRRIQKYLNDKFNANLDVDGKMGPLTIKTMKRFLPSAKKQGAPVPSRNTAVQGYKIKKDDNK